MSKEYLKFVQLEVPERKTKVIEVRNKDDFFLGTIDWDTGWRQYIFSPTAEPHKLAKSCLDQISELIKKLMEERK